MWVEPDFRYIPYMSETPPVVLTIAGFDPSSGAGVTADIKTIAAHGCYGVACMTAFTVQSTAGVRRVEAVKPSLVTDTLEELTSDIDISSVHLGMMGSGRVLHAVSDFLSKAKLTNVVLDPIIKSSSGVRLLPGMRNLRYVRSIRAAAVLSEAEPAPAEVAAARDF